MLRQHDNGLNSCCGLQQAELQLRTVAAVLETRHGHRVGLQLCRKHLLACCCWRVCSRLHLSQAVQDLVLHIVIHKTLIFAQGMKSSMSHTDAPAYVCTSCDVVKICFHLA